MQGVLLNQQKSSPNRESPLNSNIDNFSYNYEIAENNWYLSGIWYEGIHITPDI